MVSLKVDYCTHSHEQGLLAIVYKVNESTDRILVCCQHGVITHDGTRGDYWVPYVKYQVIEKADTMVPIETELQEVWNLVLAGTYKSIDQQKIIILNIMRKRLFKQPSKEGQGMHMQEGVWQELWVQEECMK
jgi:hypothetical protein